MKKETKLRRIVIRVGADVPPFPLKRETQELVLIH